MFYKRNSTIKDDLLSENPVRAGIVRYEQDYLYPSGIDYDGNEKDLIDIICL